MEYAHLVLKTSSLGSGLPASKQELRFRPFQTPPLAERAENQTAGPYAGPKLPAARQMFMWNMYTRPCAPEPDSLMTWQMGSPFVPFHLAGVCLTLDLMTSPLPPWPGLLPHSDRPRPLHVLPTGLSSPAIRLVEKHFRIR